MSYEATRHQMVVAPALESCRAVLTAAQRAAPTIARSGQIANDGAYNGQQRYLVGVALEAIRATVETAQRVLAAPVLPERFNGAALERQMGSALQALERHIAEAEAQRQEDMYLFNRQ